MSYKTFETDRLIIRPTTLEDASFILQLLNSPSWLKYIGDRNVHTVANAEDYISQKITAQLKRLGFANYTIIRKRDLTKMGTCGLYDREGLEGVDIGFAFLSNYTGKGYAYEAANRVLTAAFNDFNLQEVCAITDKDNFASQRLLEKLGLQPAGEIAFPESEDPLLLYNIKR